MSKSRNRVCPRAFLQKVQGDQFFTTCDLHDRQGNLRVMTFPSGQTVQYDYGPGGTPTFIGVNGAIVEGMIII